MLRKHRLLRISVVSIPVDSPNLTSVLELAGVKRRWEVGRMGVELISV